MKSVNFDINAQRFPSPLILVVMGIGIAVHFIVTFENSTAELVSSHSVKESEVEEFSAREELSQQNARKQAASEKSTQLLQQYNQQLSNGEKYSQERDYSKAKAFYQAALAILDSDEARNALARVQFSEQCEFAEKALAENQWNKAIPHLKQALVLQDSEEIRTLLFKTELRLQEELLDQQNQEERGKVLRLARDYVEAEEWEKAFEAYQRVRNLGELNEKVERELRKVQETLSLKEEELRFANKIEQARDLLGSDLRNGLVFLKRLQMQFPKRRLKLDKLKEEVLQKMLLSLLVKIPQGSYTIGSRLSPDEAPGHQMEIAAFQIDKYPVTNWHYLIFVEDTGHPPPPHWKNGYYLEGRDAFPVVQVCFEDAIRFAKWAKKRLPTEYEWEAAARTLKGYKYPWGNEAQFGKSNHNETDSQQTCAVDQYPPNSLGVYDFVGNVSQWTASYYQKYPNSTDKSSIYGTMYRSIRGGAFLHSLDSLRCSNRYYESPKVRLPSLGFRCAR